MTNLRVCPHCGREDFPLSSVESVEGLADITLEGEQTARWQGTVEANWELSVTRYYICRSCGRSLPEEYAVILDRLLGNTREPLP